MAGGVDVKLTRAELLFDLSNKPAVGAAKRLAKQLEQLEYDEPDCLQEGSLDYRGDDE